MNYENFTIKTQEALQEASSIALKNDNSEIGTEHVLMALLEQQDGFITPIVERVGVSSFDLINKCLNLIKENPMVSGNANVYFSQTMQKVLAKAELEMNNLHDSFLSTEHILLAMTEMDDRTASLLKQNGINHNTVIEALKSVRGNQTVNDQDPESKAGSLEKFCKDLTALAKMDKIDPVIGRDEEIRRVMQVLCRRTKNNPVIIGEPGVGKTAIVEGLARRIASGDVPDSLKNKRLLALDLGSLVAGAKFRGELKSVLRPLLMRFKSLKEESFFL